MAVHNTTEEHLGLLIKMLKMTTSDNDNQALVAMRKSNELLARCGGDWDTLLRGKVKIIGNPFENMAAPPPPTQRRAPPPPPHRPAPPPPRPQAPVYHCADCGRHISAPGVCAPCQSRAQAAAMRTQAYQQQQRSQPQPMSASQIKAARRSGSIKVKDLA